MERTCMCICLRTRHQSPCPSDLLDYMHPKHAVYRELSRLYSGKTEEIHCTVQLRCPKKILTSYVAKTQFLYLSPSSPMLPQDQHSAGRISQKPTQRLLRSLYVRQIYPKFLRSILPFQMYSDSLGVVRDRPITHGLLHQEQSRRQQQTCVVLLHFLAATTCMISFVNKVNFHTSYDFTPSNKNYYIGLAFN